jgi:hypothetical protein
VATAVQGPVGHRERPIHSESASEIGELCGIEGMSGTMAVATREIDDLDSPQAGAPLGKAQALAMSHTPVNEPPPRLRCAMIRRIARARPASA